MYYKFRDGHRIRIGSDSDRVLGVSDRIRIRSVKFCRIFLGYEFEYNFVGSDSDTTFHYVLDLKFSSQFWIQFFCTSAISLTLFAFILSPKIQFFMRISKIILVPRENIPFRRYGGNMIHISHVLQNKNCFVFVFSYYSIELSETWHLDAVFQG